jgi:large subunit ribosomal protein L24
MLQTRFHVKKDDTVMVIAGKEKGKMGKILKVLPKKNRVIVEKVNFIKRHTKASQTGRGGIIEIEGSIHVSNVTLVCKKCNSPVRTRKKILDGGKRVRICIKCEEILDK